MELHLHRFLRFYRVADHSRYRSSVQWSSAKEIRAGFAVPIAHDCCGV
jgi:hypothetical protein